MSVSILAQSLEGISDPKTEDATNVGTHGSQAARRKNNINCALMDNEPKFQRD
jgi:hypothetical protein